MIENGLLIFFAYIIGSVPFSLILSKAILGKDIRKTGSGNVGATNVFRINKKLSFIVLLLDIFKSSAVILFSEKYGSNITVQTLYIIGMSSIVGHIFPVWLRFKGGKGVATTIGVIIIMNKTITVAFLTTWLAIFLITRYSSISSIVAIIASAIACVITEDVTSTIIYLTVTMLIVVKHKENIYRMLRGEEKKIKI